MTNTHEPPLLSQLEALPEETRALLLQHRFSPEWLVKQAELSQSGERSNEVRGLVTPLSPADLLTAPSPRSADFERFTRIGEEALANGQCALAVLAGGMATRMGGVVKALVPATSGKTFLELRSAEQKTLGAKYGRVPPLWLMTSHATHDAIAEALAGQVDGEDLALFRQGLSVRLTPGGDVYRDESGAPSLHAPGHGDFLDCVRESGLLQKFVENGGKYLLVTNLDNLGGGLDPALIGMHLSQECAVTCEVVDKEEGDRGGIPVRLDGKPVILEEFRLPSSFDPSQVSVFNVNSFAFTAPALLDLKMESTFFEVRKQVESKTVIQYERLINELTFHLPTAYVRVPRHGETSRFLPIKDQSDLELRREDLAALAKYRGMI